MYSPFVRMYIVYSKSENIAMQTRIRLAFVFKASYNIDGTDLKQNAERGHDNGTADA